MSVQDWASLIVAILTIVSSIAFGIKWLVKHYLSELKTNGGSSVKDQMNRIEESSKEEKTKNEDFRDRQERKLDELYRILIQHITDSKK